jgi:hypothetical protein
MHPFSQETKKLHQDKQVNQNRSRPGIKEIARLKYGKRQKEFPG